MVGRQETELSKSFSGNILLYNFIRTRRVPVFLHRDLKRVLQAHQQELEESQTGSTVEIFESNTIPRKSWTFPSAEMVKQKYEDKKCFIAVIKAVKPMSEDGKGQVPFSTPKSLPFRLRCQFGLTVWEPDVGIKLFSPLRNADMVARQTSEGINIFAVEMNEVFREPIGRWLVPGSVTSEKRYLLQLSINFLNGGDSSDFLSHLEPGKWTDDRDTPTRFIAKWSDLPNVPKDGKLLQFECTSDGVVTKLGVEIEMRWTHPIGKTLLTHWNEQLKSKRNRNIPSPLKMAGSPVRKFKLTYTCPNDRPNRRSVTTRQSMANLTNLAEFDCLKCRHCFQAEFATLDNLREHLETRHDFSSYTFNEERLENDTMHVRIGCETAVQVSYSYGNGSDSVSFEELQCAHCFQTGFGDLDQLRMHLDSLHDKFKYKCEEDGPDNDGVIQIHFLGELDKSYVDKRASDNVPDARDVNVVAPQIPFDMKAYLQGATDLDWIRQATLAQTRPQTRQPKPTVIKNYGVKRKAPDEVAAILERSKKTFKVPKVAPEITLFRASSKRVLVEGEYVSESDDDVDMTHIKLKKASHIKKSNRRPEEIRFTLAWNDHMMDERLACDAHVGDACIRFARRLLKRGLLHDRGFMTEFLTKSSQLRKDKIISQEVMDRIIEFGSGDFSSLENGPERPRKRPRRNQRDSSRSRTSPPLTPISVVTNTTGMNTAPLFLANGAGTRNKGKARPTAHGHMTPQNTDSDGDADMAEAVSGASLKKFANDKKEDHTEEEPQLEVCICGKRIALAGSNEPIIWCEDPFCLRHSFHLACVIDKWKPEPVPNPFACNWICKNCEDRGDPTET